jgi:hypothetical protein
MEYSYVQKCRNRKMRRMKEERKEGKKEGRPAVVQNKDSCFHVRVYNGCAGLGNKKKQEGIEHSPSIFVQSSICIFN